MGVFTAVIEIATLTILDPGQNLALGGAVAFQLVGDDDPGTYVKLLNNLRKNFFTALLLCRLCIKIARTLPS
jgi:hypothetical protein